MNNIYYDITSLISVSIENTLSYIAENEAVFLQSLHNYLNNSPQQIDISEYTILPSVFNPKKVVCVGINYSEHSNEFKSDIPKEPIIFSKFSDTIVATKNPIISPECVKKLDYECELVIIIKDDCYNVSIEDSKNHILGFTIANDVSARDWQLERNNKQWTIGKTFPTFCPLGPSFVLSTDFNPLNKSIKTYVNNELRQNSNTSKMIFNVYELVAWISNLFPLHCGDIILTGTPEGVGAFSNPPKFLKVNDVVKCIIEDIGCLENTVQKQENINNKKDGILLRLNH